MIKVPNMYKWQIMNMDAFHEIKSSSPLKTMVHFYVVVFFSTNAEQFVFFWALYQLKKTKKNSLTSDPIPPTADNW